jgi:hypothetical protein
MSSSTTSLAAAAAAASQPSTLDKLLQANVDASRDQRQPVRFNSATKKWEVYSTPVVQQEQPGFFSSAYSRITGAAEAQRKGQIELRINSLDGSIREITEGLRKELQSNTPQKKDINAVSILFKNGLETDLRALGCSESEITQVVQQLKDKFAPCVALAGVLNTYCDAMAPEASSSSDASASLFSSTPDYRGVITRLNTTLATSTNVIDLTNAVRSKASTLKQMEAMRIQAAGNKKPAPDRDLEPGVRLADVVDVSLVSNLPKADRKLAGVKAYYKEVFKNAKLNRPDLARDLDAISNKIQLARSVPDIKSILHHYFFNLAQVGILDCHGAGKTLGRTHIQPQVELKATAREAIEAISTYDESKRTELSEILWALDNLRSASESAVVSPQALDQQLAKVDAINKGRRQLVEHAQSRLGQKNTDLVSRKREITPLREKVQTLQKQKEGFALQELDLNGKLTSIDSVIKGYEASIAGIHNNKIRFEFGKLTSDENQRITEYRAASAAKEREKLGLSAQRDEITRAYDLASAAHTQAQQELREANTRLNVANFEADQAEITALQNLLSSSAALPPVYTNCQQAVGAFKQRQVDVSVAKSKAFANQYLITSGEMQTAIISYAVVPAVAVIARCVFGF